MMKSQTKLFLAMGILCAAVLQAQELKWEIAPFVRPAKGNPVIAPRAESTFIDPILKRPVHWEVLHTFNPAAIVRDGKVYVLYRAEDDSGAMEIGGHTSRLGLAESADGITFVWRGEPALYPADDSQQTRERPAESKIPASWRRKTAATCSLIRSGTARVFRRHRDFYDLTHWQKHGQAFAAAAEGKYADLRYKSAGIVTRLNKDKGRLLATKINGRYWMYWGEARFISRLRMT